MKRCFQLFILLIAIKGISFGQYYENGQDPFSIHWKKIETPHFKVIFSHDAVAMGKQYAAYLEEIYKTGGNTLSFSPRKISVIIHNQNVLSNGEVAWAPKRMNLYAIQPQDGYSEIYGKHLALHEFRHVVQIDKTNQSSTRLLYYLFGEQAIGAIIGWHIPRWFFEGDAVAYETGSSNSGRGRNADFTMKLNAQVYEKGIFSYPKAQFGSYKDFVPNHYELGYQLVSRARLKYGYKIWDSTLYQVAKSPIHANAFSKGIKNVSGLPERKLYKEFMEDFESELTKHAIETSDKKKEYVNYYSPYALGADFISYKTSYGDIPRIVITDASGKDKTVHTPGYILNQTFTYHDSVLVWNEYKVTRWYNDSYTRIVCYDLRTDDKKYLTKKTRVFYSRISPDKSKILSVEVDLSLNWSLTIRDANTGVLIDSIGFNKLQPVQPAWSPDMSEVVFMQIGEMGKSLGIINLVTHEINWLLQDEYLEMSNPVHTGNAILIKGIYNGASNYLQYDLKTAQWIAVTDAIYGVGEGSYSNKVFVYSNYSSNGYKLQRANMENVSLTPISKPEMYETKLTQLLAKEEVLVNLTGLDTSFQVQNYSKIKSLFNVHSWVPLGVNIQNIEVGPGVTLMSQNALSTSILTGGYQYGMTDGSHRYFADYYYKGFYPILNTSFSKTYFSDSILAENDTAYFVKYSDVSVYNSVSFPFNFDRGKWITRFQPQMAYEYKGITPSSENLIQLTDPKIHNLYGQLYFYKLLVTSLRDLQSKWGLVVNLNYMSSPFKSGQMGQLASAESWLYFPGLMQNHGLRIYTGIQIKEYGDYSFSDRLVYPTGYMNYHNTQMVSGHANYVFPLLYPDLNVFEYVYIKRLKANVFYQYSTFEYQNSQFDLSSAGVDLTANLHLFRFVFPFEMGVRYARRISFNDNYYQFLFKVNF